VDNKKLQTKRQTEPGEIPEETSGCVRPARVNKWPNSMLTRWLWWRWS